MGLSRFSKRKIDRKRDFCLNCDFPMPDDYNFCPRCGQENVDNRAAIGMLAEEFINTFFAYDSRFFRSIFPFLFKPGFLTNQFLVGRRLTYVHPLRLYLIISLIYFTILSLEINVEGNALRSSLEGLDTESKELPAGVDSVAKGAQKQADSIKAEVRRELEKEGIANPFGPGKDSVREPKDSVRKPKRSKDTGPEINLGEGRDFDLAKIKRWSKDRDIKPDAILDSLGIEHNYWNRKFAEQSLKIVRRDTESLIEYFLSKTSLMMFLLLPFFALLLKLFYIRSKRYYIEHLVFTLHIHSFLFFLLTVLLLSSEVYKEGHLLGWTMLLLFVYLLFSFRNVYRQGWFKTIFKMFVLLIFYVTSLAFFLVGTVIISFLMF